MVTLKINSAPIRGFTLVEVLVVIAIIGVLVALLLPAVQMARESARRISCTNNVRQCAVAVKLHTDTHKTFPTGGWGADWIGDPDAGFGPKQPGGWIYNVLPYLEEADLREIGSGLPMAQKRLALVTLLESPVEVLNCPSRRLPRPYPYTGAPPLNCAAPQMAAKNDYAINHRLSFKESEIILAEIQLHEGLSKTVLVGEKSLEFSNYTNGMGGGDRLTMYVGDCNDIARAATGNPLSDATASRIGFGAPHPGGANFAYCDGSVRFINEDQDLGSMVPSE